MRLMDNIFKGITSIIYNGNILTKNELNIINELYININPDKSDKEIEIINSSNIE